MSEISYMSLDQLLELIEVMRAEMVPGGMSEAMLGSYLLEALEAYDGAQDEYEKFLQSWSDSQDGVGTNSS